MNGILGSRLVYSDVAYFVLKLAIALLTFILAGPILGLILVIALQMGSDFAI